jgi:phage gp16-like protein
MTKSADLAKIHIAKKALGLDDDTYRALLQRVGGVDSARDLDASARGRVLAELRRGGWKPKPPRAAASRVLASEPQARKIRALWLALFEAGAVRDPSETALAHYVRRQTGVERLQWLDTRQANRAIESLKGWAARVGAPIE